MRPQVEEIEDDLAAEEENKLINEASAASALSGFVLQCSLTYSSLYLQEYKTWCTQLFGSFDSFVLTVRQEEKCALSIRCCHHPRTRLAKFDLPMVPGQGIVRLISLVLPLPTHQDA
jgi:hypothetical protein